MEEILATCLSRTQARKFQDTFASEGGGWVVSSYNKYSAVYFKAKDGVTEELLVRKRGIRKWDVVKIIMREVKELA